MNPHWLSVIVGGLIVVGGVVIALSHRRLGRVSAARNRRLGARFTALKLLPWYPAISKDSTGKWLMLVTGVCWMLVGGWILIRGILG